MATKKTTKAKKGAKPKKTSALATKTKTAAIYWPVKKTAEPKDIESARMTFDAFRRKGLKAHYLDAKGNPAEPMKEFDETAGGMIFL